MLTDIQTLSSKDSGLGQSGYKFATKILLKMPSHRKHVATLPCEVWYVADQQ